MTETDVLMITYNRPRYTRLALDRLLRTADGSTRIWIWHNGSDVETLEVARAAAEHPCVHAFHHSPVNERLTAPTNWLWSNATGDYLGKVDDDCLVDPGWLTKLRAAHDSNRSFGVVGSWRFYPEDFVPDACAKIRTYRAGQQLLRNCWTQGSGYLMKRRCVESQGLLRPGQNFTDYCVRLEKRGFVNGWRYPFVLEDHMDDPRSRFTELLTDADLQANLPLSAIARGIANLDDWTLQMRRSARVVQAASLNPRVYVGFRGRANFFMRRFLPYGGRIG